MKCVGVAKLKSRLSYYLRAVRRARTVTVFDRDQPVARLVPLEGDAGMRVRRRGPGAPRPADIPLLPPLDLGFDVVELVLEERGQR